MSGARLSTGDAYLLATAVVWGASFPTGKVVLDVMPPLSFASIRFILASLVLFAILAARGESLAVRWRDMVQLTLIGVFGYTLFQAIWALGLDLTTASKASILISTSPAFLALISVARGERPSLRNWIGIATAFAGVYLIVNNGLVRFQFDAQTWKGDALFVCAAILWAIYTGFAPPILQRHGALKATAYCMAIGALLLLPAGLWQLSAMDWDRVTPLVVANFAFIVVFSAALGFLWWFAGIGRLGVARAMPYMYLVPVFGVALAVLFLGETLSSVQIIGGVLVLAGVSLARSAP